MSTKTHDQPENLSTVPPNARLHNELESLKGDVDDLYWYFDHVLEPNSTRALTIACVSLIISLGCLIALFL